MKMPQIIKKAGDRYSCTTPKHWRKVGDSLLGVSTMITGYGIMADHDWLAITALVIGVVGKFLSDFFKEEE